IAAASCGQKHSKLSPSHGLFAATAFSYCCFSWYDAVVARRSNRSQKFTSTGVNQFTSVPQVLVRRSSGAPQRKAGDVGLAELKFELKLVTVHNGDCHESG